MWANNGALSTNRLITSFTEKLKLFGMKFTFIGHAFIVII
jgi:hypothetical protein